MALFKIESGAQLIARLRKKPLLQNFYPYLFQSEPKQEEIIEMYSDNNITPLVNDFICEALLPTCLDGPDVGVLVFSCSTNFNFDALVSCMNSKIQSREALRNDDEMHILLHKMMCNFYMLEIYDALQLYTTIHNIDSIFETYPNISVIIFENISSFYWAEQKIKITKMDIYLKNMLQLIQRATRDHKVLILYTRPGYFSSNKESIENLEPCCEKPTIDKINYRIQIEHIIDNTYQVNLRSYNGISKRRYCIENYILKWL